LVDTLQSLHHPVQLRALRALHLCRPQPLASGEPLAPPACGGRNGTRSASPALLHRDRGEIWGRYGGDMGRSASPALPHRACAVQTPMQTLLARGVRSREAAEGGSREASRCVQQPTPRRSGAWRQRRHGYNAGMATAPAGPCARTGASGQRSRRRPLARGARTPEAAAACAAAAASMARPQAARSRR